MDFLNIIYPHKCVFCGQILGDKSLGVCSSCKKHLPYVTEPVCKRCGKPIDDMRGHYCDDCESRGLSPVTEGVAVWSYEGVVRKAIADFKYAGYSEDRRFYADELAKRMYDKLSKWRLDIIIPVPVHKRRKWFRGYDQAAELADALSEIIGIPSRDDILIRDKDTAPQKKLSNRQRQINLRSAFTAKNDVDAINMKRVLLVDDIYTTGATARACAAALISAGADKVYSACLCIGSQR